VFDTAPCPSHLHTQHLPFPNHHWGCDPAPQLHARMLLLCCCEGLHVGAWLCSSQAVPTTRCIRVYVKLLCLYPRPAPYCLLQQAWLMLCPSPPPPHFQVLSNRTCCSFVAVRASTLARSSATVRLLLHERSSEACTEQAGQQTAAERCGHSTAHNLQQPHQLCC
jgi:hypothetical protein